MFGVGRLREAIEGLGLAGRADDVAAVLALRDRLDAMIVAALVELDATRGWADSGATGLHGWLRAEGGLAADEAARLVLLARRCGRLPHTLTAWQAGEVRTRVVRAIARTCDTTAVLDAFAAGEVDLVGVLAPLDEPTARAALAHWRERVRAHLGADEGLVPERSGLWLTQMDDRWRLDASLAAGHGTLLSTALAAAEVPNDDGFSPHRDAAQRRADALADICRFFLDHRQTTATPRQHPHVNMLVGYDSVAAGRPVGSTPDGTVLDVSTLRAWMCEAGYSRVLTGPDGTIIDYGSTRRLFSQAQINGLLTRDGCCRFPGCGRGAAWTHAHHITPHPLGPTSLTNSALMCARHHEIIHRPGWHLTLHPDGRLDITNPQGQTRTTWPRHHHLLHPLDPPTAA